MDDAPKITPPPPMSVQRPAPPKTPAAPAQTAQPQTSVPAAPVKAAQPSQIAKAPVPRPAAPSTPPPKTPQQASAGISVARIAMQSFGPVAGARADLFYGDTNTTKTTQLAWIADYLKQRYDKPSRLISADPAGWESIQDSVDEGTIEAFALGGHRSNLYESVEKLCLGYWPKDVNDPESPLIPPRDNGLKDIAGVFFEGLKSICDLLMRVHTVDIDNIRVPEMPDPDKTRIKSGSYIQRFTGRSDYMGIQDAIAAFVRDSGMLPVHKVVWTSQELQSHIEKTGAVRYGPDIIGQALTGSCGPWFGNFIHMDMINVQVQAVDPMDKSKKITVLRPSPFMFLRSHIDAADPFKRAWPAKTRAVRSQWPKVPDYMEPRADKFYAMMDELVEEAKKLRAQPSQTK